MFTQGKIMFLSTPDIIINLDLVESVLRFEYEGFSIVFILNNGRQIIKFIDEETRDGIFGLIKSNMRQCDDIFEIHENFLKK